MFNPFDIPKDRPKLSDESEEFLSEVKRWVSDLVDYKFRLGELEHGDYLTSKSMEWLQQNIIFENVDSLVYGFAMYKLKQREKSGFKFKPSNLQESS